MAVAVLAGGVALVNNYTKMQKMESVLASVLPANVESWDKYQKMQEEEFVAFGIADRDIDDKKVWEALEKAQLKEFVMSLPEGIHTEVGERGMRLSGGQRQRIGIARALYRDPEILVFDEATSALDNETEKEVMSAINSLHGTKTMIMIAHRLTTIENCDHVYQVSEKTIEQIR